MSDRIEFTDIKNEYIDVEDAREMSGLRMVLGAYPIPGPWRESCKGIFYVKGLSYTSVKTANRGESDLGLGMGGSQSELISWTSQSSAPVAIWQDERPRFTWSDQLNLAERLEPEPRLVPENAADRVLMFGLINELAGEFGAGWMGRHILVKTGYRVAAESNGDTSLWDALAEKYGYSEKAAEASNARIAGVFNQLNEQLAAQKKIGSKYLIGDSLSALDIYHACFFCLFKPMEQKRCPMATDFRPFYECSENEVLKSLSPSLEEHRDYIYKNYLELPIVF